MRALQGPLSTLLHHTVLATSLAGNAVDLLTITAAPDRGKPLHQRQGVVLSGEEQAQGVPRVNLVPDFMCVGALILCCAGLQSLGASLPPIMYGFCVTRPAHLPE